MTRGAPHRPAQAFDALRAIARRHERRVWLLWAAGAVLLLTTPLALADPAMLMLLLDPELLAIAVMAAVALMRATGARLVPRSVLCRWRRRP